MSSSIFSACLDVPYLVVRSHYVGPIHIWGLSADVLSLEIHITSSMLPLVISGESDADDGEYR